MKEHRPSIFLSLGIILIIFVVPLVLTLPSIWERLNYSSTGAIGDTIGGLTAPFINGLGAILVYIAFREQVKANRLLSSREHARDILDQIRSIEQNGNDQYPFEKTVGQIIDNAERMTMSSRDLTVTILLDSALYFLSEFALAKNLLEHYSGDKTFLYNKLGFLYTIKYSAHIRKLKTSLESRLGIQNNHHDGTIAEIISTINVLDNYFDSIINKYRDQNRNYHKSLE